jgi:hypothetical protein
MVLEKDQFHNPVLFNSGLRDWMVICDVQGEPGSMQALDGATAQGGRGVRAGRCWFEMGLSVVLREL